MSDIIGILAEHEKRGTPISKDAINNAIKNLYGDWGKIPAESKAFIENAFLHKNYEELYASVNQEENHSKKLLIQFEQDYPGITNPSNANDILNSLKAK